VDARRGLTRPDADSAAPLLADDPVAGAAANTTSAALVAGGLWSAAARVIPQLYTLVILVAAAHYLGPERLGRQSYIAFVELSVIMLATAGMPTAVMRYVGESLGRGRPGSVRALIRWAWAVELAAGLLGGGGIAAAALLGADPTAAWVLAGIAAALGVFHTVPSALLIGAQRWRAASVVGLATGSLGTAATVAVLAAGGGITSMFAVEAAVGVANLAWTSLLARRTVIQLTTTTEPAGELRRQTLRYALLASVGIVLSFIVWRRSEFFFLQRYSTYTEIALYSIPFSLVSALVRVFEAATAVVTPAVATLYGAGAHERIRVGYSRVLRLLVLASLPLTAAMLSLGPATLRLLGRDYRGTGTVTVIMLATFPFVPLAKAATSLLHGLGRVRFVMIAGAVGAAANVLLDILIIPGHGAVGAAIANGGAQVTAAIPALIYSAKAAGAIEWQPRFIVRGGILSLVVGLATWGATDVAGGGAAGIGLGLLAALGAFALTGPLLRVLPPDDAAWLQRLTGTRLRGVPARFLRACAPRVDRPGLGGGRPA
jgi:O-antigen/teichoic acid export membrane protein